MHNEKHLLRHIPNLISIVRILLVVVFAVFFSEHKYVKSLIVYCVAFFSDILDGFLARRYNWITSLGKLLDPLADKLMLITALICFCSERLIPVWILIAIGIKDFILCICGVLLYKRGVVVEADVSGKIATGMWTAAVVSLLMLNVFPFVKVLADIITVFALLTSLLALVNYAARYFVETTSTQ